MFGEQGLAAAVRRGNDPDRAAAPALIDQQHRPRGLVAFDLDAGHPVSELAGHGQPKLRRLRAGFDGNRLTGKQAAVLPARTHLKEAGRRCRQRAQNDAQILCRALAGSEQQGRFGRRSGEIPQAPAAGDIARQCLICAALRDPVAEPDGGTIIRQRRSFEPGQRILSIHRPRFGQQCLDRGAGVRRAQRSRHPRRLVAGDGSGGEEHDLPVFALGFGEYFTGCGLTRRPVARRRPAVIDGEQERTRRCKARLRVEERVGDGKDHQRGQRHAQQDQPERGARRRLFPRDQPEQ